VKRCGVSSKASGYSGKSGNWSETDLDYNIGANTYRIALEFSQFPRRIVFKTNGLCM
jgi:hypothetical protein